MTFKLITAVVLLSAMSVHASAQQNGPPPNAPKPSVADVQKLVQAIGADKVKLRAYCDMGKVLDQMDRAEQKHDAKALKALSVQADVLADQLGPDYQKVMVGLNSVDPNSAEGKQYGALFDPIFKLCK